MPATPAWPPKSLPRLFVDRDLSSESEFPLEPEHQRYLLASLRKKDGDAFCAFDDRTGEYQLTLKEIAKGRWSALVGEHIGGREEVPDLWLCLSPIQRDNFAMVAEKACELGVRRFQPVAMHRTIVREINAGRLRARMIEAAEQCERTALPEIEPIVRLEKLLSGWPTGRVLFFCDERGGEPAAPAMSAQSGTAAILVGPEGGFDDGENAMIRDHPQAVPISLGPRILRAETAAISAVSLWMAAVGDWRG
jgi:16S rRNA (uracil1498-N3)-methyltransferase